MTTGSATIRNGVVSLLILKATQLRLGWFHYQRNIVGPARMKLGVFT